MKAPKTERQRPKTERGAAKKDQILAGARQVFMERGFEGAAIDEIARVAGVSKPTLYRYFPDKRHLYAAIFARECERIETELFPADLDTAEIADVLDRVGRRYLERLLSAEVQDAFRISLGDAQRFPELARDFYLSGPGRGASLLEKILAAHTSRGNLAIDDIPLATAQFFAMCKADLFYKTAFGVIEPPDAAQIDRIVTGAVATFLRAYGPGPRD